MKLLPDWLMQPFRLADLPDCSSLLLFALLLLMLL